MSDQVIPPVEPVVETPPQQVATPPATQPQDIPEGYIEKARFDGLVRKVEELTLTNRAVNEQLTQLSSEKELLTGQLAIKDVDKSVAVGEYQKQIEAAIQTQTQQASELGELRALKAKMELVRKHNAGHLIPILDRIPYLEDAEAMETVFTDFLNWGDNIAKTREKELLAGYTPSGAGPAEPTNTTPTTKESWLAHIQKQTGTDAQKAWKQYWEWGAQQE